MNTAIALFYFKYNDFQSKSYYENSIETIIKRFIEDTKRAHMPEVLWAYLYDSDGNVLKEYKHV